jgi:hypothetical protein
MKLTRRDAVVALGALGVGSAAALGIRESGSDTESAGEEIQEAFVAIAEVVYPSELSGIEEFVDSFLAGRLSRESHGEAVGATVEQLNELASEWHGGRVSTLDPDTRDQLLRELGADTADEVPNGTTAERVRYYIVNELLLALYASPTGGELVGIENPQGHPGGTETYQRGPQP